MRPGAVVRLINIILACTLAACTPVVVSPSHVVPTSTVQQAAGLTPTKAGTRLPTQTPAATATATTAASATALPPPAVCSPLDDILLEELGLPDLLKSPFEQPLPGADDGHHGVDFAYWSRGEHDTMLGLPVKAALTGRVAAVLPDRQPYGNAVILETSLKGLPVDWLSAISAPIPAPTSPPAPNLICPAVSELTGLVPGEYPQDYALYLLYAHFNEPPPLSVGQVVECGQEIGKVGTTGRSVNAHLHLETRIGPAGAMFTSMAHYQNDASEIEMGNYCVWRISGLFQLMDPMGLLSLQP